MHTLHVTEFIRPCISEQIIITSKLSNKTWPKDNPDELLVTGKLEGSNAQEKKLTWKAQAIGRVHFHRVEMGKHVRCRCFYVENKITQQELTLQTQN